MWETRIKREVRTENNFPKVNKYWLGIPRKVNKDKVHLWHQRLAKIYRLARQCIAVVTSWPGNFGVRSILWSSAHPKLNFLAKLAWVPKLIQLTLTKNSFQQNYEVGIATTHHQQLPDSLSLRSQVSLESLVVGGQPVVRRERFAAWKKTGFIRIS